MTLSVHIRHRQGSFTLNAAFEAPQGVTVLFGRSGAGKSSVMKAVAGLLRPDAGRIALDDEVLFDSAAGVNRPVHRRRLGYVFQEGRLFPHLTVRQNLLYARAAQPGAGFDHVVGLLGIEPLLERRPGALSGGEVQRVAIGRALLSKPRMLLMDEPLAALDAERKAEILPYLERMRSEASVPILYVSHNLTEVARLANHMVVMEAGHVTRSGPAEQVLSDPEMVRFLGVRDAGSVLSGHVVAHSDDGITELQVSGGRLILPRVDAPTGAPLRVRILAQDVILASHRPEGLSAQNILGVEVVSVRRGAGPGVMVQLRWGDDLLLARITQRGADALGLAPGAACFAVLKSLSVARVDIGQGLHGLA